jgi:hypothetical protein
MENLLYQEENEHENDPDLITMAEMTQAIDKLKQGKTPGQEEINLK